MTLDDSRGVNLDVLTITLAIPLKEEPAVREGADLWKIYVRIIFNKSDEVARQLLTKEGGKAGNWREQRTR